MICGFSPELSDVQHCDLRCDGRGECEASRYVVRFLDGRRKRPVLGGENCDGDRDVLLTRFCDSVDPKASVDEGVQKLRERNLAHATDFVPYAAFSPPGGGLMSSCLAIGRVHDQLSCGEAVYMWSVEARVHPVEQKSPGGTQDSCGFSDHALEVVDVRGRPSAHDQIEGLGVEREVLGVGLVNSGASLARQAKLVLRDVDAGCGPAELFDDGEVPTCAAPDVQARAGSSGEDLAQDRISVGTFRHLGVIPLCETVVASAVIWDVR